MTDADYDGMQTPDSSSDKSEPQLDFVDHFKTQFWQEFALFKVYWKRLIFNGLFQFVHQWFHNLVYILHERRPALRDMGFELIPALPKGARSLSEAWFFTLFLSAFVMCATPLFIRQRPGEKRRYGIVMLSRFVVCLTVAIALRIVCFMVTILPAPAPHCQPGSADYDPPSSASEVLLEIEALKGCGDLLFSSHTVMAVLSACLITRYAPWVWAKVFMWINILVFGYLVVAARKHYTVDVWVAWYTTPMVFLLSEIYLPDVSQADIDAIVNVNSDYHQFSGARRSIASQLDAATTEKMAAAASLNPALAVPPAGSINGDVPMTGLRESAPDAPSAPVVRNKSGHELLV